MNSVNTTKKRLINLAITLPGLILYMYLNYYIYNNSFNFWIISSILLVMSIIGVGIFTKSLLYINLSAIPLFPWITFMNSGPNFGVSKDWINDNYFNIILFLIIATTIEYLIKRKIKANK